MDMLNIASTGMYTIYKTWKCEYAENHHIRSGGLNAWTNYTERAVIGLRRSREAGTLFVMTSSNEIPADI